MNATSIHNTTLVGVGGPLPTRGGNCFTVETDTGEYFYISNMRLENFEGLIKQGMMNYPIEIEPVTDNSAKVIDSRAPADWLTEDICPVCYR